MIRDSDGNALVDVLLLSSVPRPDPHKIRNRLLNGTWHVQTVGDPAQELEVTVWALIPGRNTIDTHSATGAPLTVETDEGNFTGYVIDDKILWQRIARGTVGRREYEATFTLGLLEGGMA